MLSGGEKQTSIRVGFNSSSDGRKSGFIVDATEGIECGWYSLEHAIDEPLQINNGKSEVLKCSRDSSDKKGSINIIDKLSTDLNTFLTFPWTAYQEKIPVSLITSYNDAYRELDAINKSLSGAVVTFNADTCPTGWKNAPTAWSGRYMVFSKANQSPGALVGSALTQSENRSTGTHRHEGTVAFFGGDCQDDNGCASWGTKGGIKRSNTNTRNTKPSSDKFTVSEGTNAPYVTLIGCVRE